MWASEEGTDLIGFRPGPCPSGESSPEGEGKTEESKLILLGCGYIGFGQRLYKRGVNPGRGRLNRDFTNNFRVLDGS